MLQFWAGPGLGATNPSMCTGTFVEITTSTAQSSLTNYWVTICVQAEYATRLLFSMQDTRADKDWG